MDIPTLLRELGHVATREQLLRRCTRGELDAALRAGTVERVRRGTYATAGLEGDRRLARRHGGVLSHESAALVHGLRIKDHPDLPWITVPRSASERGHESGCCHRRYRRIDPQDHRGGVTTPLRTVLDCARDLPFDRALVVADGALAARLVTQHELLRAAARMRGPGSAQARRVARHATEHSSGPMESVLRAIALDCGLEMVPQLQVSGIGLWATVDLGHETLRLALEADSFAWHGDRRALDRDCRRYDELVVFGWTVLRFSWEQIMLEPEWVAWCLRNVIAGRAGETPPPPPRARRPRRPPSSRPSAGTPSQTRR